MSNVKGNDIDDLFKRAADKYPLRTDSADWNKLAADLDKDRSLIIPPVNMEGGDKRKRRRFLWLFLLLPLGGIGYYALQSSKQTQATVQHGSSQTPAKAEGDQAVPSGKGSNPEDAVSAGTPTTEAAKNTPTTESGKNTPATESTGKTPATTGTPSGTTARETPAATATSSGTPASPHDKTIASAHPAGENSNRVRKTHMNEPVASVSNSGLAEGQTINKTLTKRASTEGQITGKRRTKGLSTAQPATGEQGSVSQTANDVRVNSRQTAMTPGIAEDKTSTPSNRSSGNRNAGPTIGDRDLSLSALKSPRALTSGGVALDVTVNARNSPVTTKDNSGSKKNSPAKNKKQSFLYAGLLVAPDLSTIKFQSVKGVGTTFGVLLGYQFNRKWAVETGVSLDHKKYYTDGEYFKLKNPPSNYKLLNVDGYCNMWEIPVNLRYNISLGEKTKWFAAAGLSTYLMTHEHYVSTGMYNGTVSTYPWDVKSPSQYWFSIINLSLGFEQKLGKIGNLRIEPYARIPLSGLGTGNLSIMSAGLNIGITRRIW